ncbi:MAG: BtrH N-terminal domain-containing protein [Lutisporaceae bacterium]
MKILIRDFIINSGFHSCFRAGSTCYTSALRDVMSYYDSDVDISEVDLFFIINGLNITFYDDNTNGFLGYNFEENQNMSIFGSRCKISSYRNTKKNKEQICEWVISSLKRNEPIICFMETKYLDYHNIYKENGSGVHAITLFGVDSENDKCYVLDSHIRINFGKFEFYIGEFSLTNFIEGLLCTWEFDTSRCSTLNIDLHEYIVSGIKNYISGCCIDNKMYCGSKALDKYIDNCRKQAETDDKEEFISLCNRMHFNIKINGPCYINNNLSLLCKKVGNHLEENEKEFNMLNAGWVNLASVILAAGYQNSKKRFHSVLARVEILMQKQTKAIQNLLDKLVETGF